MVFALIALLVDDADARPLRICWRLALLAGVGALVTFATP